MTNLRRLIFILCIQDVNLFCSMPRILLFFYLLTRVFAAAAQEKKLYLFVTKDTLHQGVKDADGQVVVPAEFPNIGMWSDGELLVDSILDFYGLPVDKPFVYDSLRAAYTANTTFDRDGKVLYFPFFFDNGADFIQEGARRFVDIRTYKMGLTHPYGDVLIPATYDFISPLQDGYVLAYNGVKRKTVAGGEHWIIVPDSDKRYERVVLDKQGNPVEGQSAASESHPLRLGDDSLFYPRYYQARSTEEKLLLERLQADTDVKALFSPLPEGLQLNIYERPRPNFPFYVVGVSADFSSRYLIVDAMGTLYFFDYYRPKVLLRQYLKEWEASLR